jgi:hypothetical protein
MLTTLAIQQMSRVEKLRIMEALWEDLSREEHLIDSPAWHEEALRETEQRVAAGQEPALDWENAKKQLRQRFP